MHYTAFLWSLGGLLLLYVGSESAVGGLGHDLYPKNDHTQN